MVGSIAIVLLTMFLRLVVIYFSGVTVRVGVPRAYHHL
jgi:hypothetical protein